MNRTIQTLTGIVLTGTAILTMEISDVRAMTPKQARVEALMIEVMKATEGKEPALYEQAKKTVDDFKEARQLEKEAREAQQNVDYLKSLAKNAPKESREEDLTITVKNFIAWQTGSDGNTIGHQRSAQIINEAGPELERYLGKFREFYPQYNQPHQGITVHKR